MIFMEIKRKRSMFIKNELVLSVAFENFLKKKRPLLNVSLAAPATSALHLSREEKEHSISLSSVHSLSSFLAAFFKIVFLLSSHLLAFSNNIGSTYT